MNAAAEVQQILDAALQNPIQSGSEADIIARILADLPPTMDMAPLTPAELDALIQKQISKMLTPLAVADNALSLDGTVTEPWAALILRLYLNTRAIVLSEIENLPQQAKGERGAWLRAQLRSIRVAPVRRRSLACRPRARAHCGAVGRSRRPGSRRAAATISGGSGSDGDGPGGDPPARAVAAFQPTPPARTLTLVPFSEIPPIPDEHYAVLVRAKFKCVICGKKRAGAVNLIVPAAYGGTDTPDNLQAVHERCGRVRHQIEGSSPTPPDPERLARLSAIDPRLVVNLLRLAATAHRRHNYNSVDEITLLERRIQAHVGFALKSYTKPDHVPEADWAWLQTSEAYDAIHSACWALLASEV